MLLVGQVKDWKFTSSFSDVKAMDDLELFLWSGKNEKLVLVYSREWKGRNWS